MDSKVDLNPHQIDAALFAFKSPLSRGAILADEVGLGKTIEAGIVLSQKWAERKRKILIILPSSLRKQWYEELKDKFFLPSKIIEAKSFNKAIKEGSSNPFDINEIAICSYHFARNKSDFIRWINWDLVVIDEAHKLRNVYKPSNVIATEIKKAIQHSPILLLTATPLQNSLLELFGLVSFIDEYTFGDKKSFSNQFARITNDTSYSVLKNRLKPICKRTLRRQVLEYIKYTERKAYTQEFIPTKEEEVLYEMVSDYLRRANLQALPPSQRSLMTLVLRKLLASSTFAIAGALESLKRKLEKRLKEDIKYYPEDDDIELDFEIYNEIVDELDYEEEKIPQPLTDREKELIQSEIEDLNQFLNIAIKITNNAKGESLVKALSIGFQMTKELGADEKAIIFTESRRTQNYLFNLLSENRYGGEIVLFNGSNTDLKSKEIYSNWKEKYFGTDKFTGSKSADTRAAIVEYFKSDAKIMIATEAGAEGINLQFCSFVVNYDLPWNPQRIEQRIGRCHRYGQKYDVVVVNFLNKKNAADQRVYELLSEKFQLFNGVFGASDEVLGTIESGVDFEKRIAEIYQTCRTTEEIESAFNELQEDMSGEIDEKMKNTRNKLLENFDSEVAEKLNVYKADSIASLNKFESLLWDITTYHLEGIASFDNRNLRFELDKTPHKSIPDGSYSLKRSDSASHYYRINSPLGQYIINQSLNKKLTNSEIVFNYSRSNKKISILEDLVGNQGVLSVKKLTIKALDIEDYIICTGKTEHGKILDEEQARRIFDLPATLTGPSLLDNNFLKNEYEVRKKSVLIGISGRNSKYFDDEIDKLNGWADDKRKSLKFTLKDYDDTIRDLKKQARQALNLPDKLSIQKKIRNLDRKRDEAWRDYDKAAKEIEIQKDALIDEVEARLNQEIIEEELFTIKWKLV